MTETSTTEDALDKRPVTRLQVPLGVRALLRRPVADRRHLHGLRDQPGRGRARVPVGLPDRAGRAAVRVRRLREPGLEMAASGQRLRLVAELIGPRYGWFTGWAYMWGLTLTLAVLPITASPYILAAAGVNAPSQITVELVAIGVLLFGSVANLFGGRLLKGLIYIALACEIIASAGHRHHPADLPPGQPVVGHLQHRRHRPRQPAGCSARSCCPSPTSPTRSSASRPPPPSAKRSRSPARCCPRRSSSRSRSAGCSSSSPARPRPRDPGHGRGGLGQGRQPDRHHPGDHAYGSGAGRTLLIALAIGFTSSMIAVQTAVTRAIWASARDRAASRDQAAGQAFRAGEPAPVRDRPDHRHRRGTDLRRHVQGVHAAGVLLRVRLHPVVLLADRRRWRYKHWRGQSPTERRVGCALDPRGHHRGRRSG